MNLKLRFSLSERYACSAARTAADKSPAASACRAWRINSSPALGMNWFMSSWRLSMICCSPSKMAAGLPLSSTAIAGKPRRPNWEAKYCNTGSLRLHIAKVRYSLVSEIAAVTAVLARSHEPSSIKKKHKTGFSIEPSKTCWKFSCVTYIVIPIPLEKLPYCTVLGYDKPHR